jgi:ESCRT-II complex subunit
MKHNKQHILTADFDLFTNTAIKSERCRNQGTLAKPTQTLILKHLIKQGKAEFVGEKYLIYFKTLRDWADVLAKWVVSSP